MRIIVCLAIRKHVQHGHVGTFLSLLTLVVLLLKVGATIFFLSHGLHEDDEV
jgi:hypothetical protein